jgi:hypothetical protein
MLQGIFARQGRLKSSTMRTVAERRYDDAHALRRTEENARANGVAYLAGFVVEILLKAKLVDKYPTIAKMPQHEVSDDEREVWSLIWKRHDLEDMLSHLSQLEASIKKKGERDGYDYHGNLKKICATWTIQQDIRRRQF